MTRCYNGLGLCHSFQNEVQEAIAWFDRSLEVSPQDQSALHNRAKVLATIEVEAVEAAADRQRDTDRTAASDGDLDAVGYRLGTIEERFRTYSEEHS